jgi:hypothetical protein
LSWTADSVAAPRARRQQPDQENAESAGGPARSEEKARARTAVQLGTPTRCRRRCEQSKRTLTITAISAMTMALALPTAIRVGLKPDHKQQQHHHRSASRKNCVAPSTATHLAGSCALRPERRTSTAGRQTINVNANALEISVNRGADKTRTGRDNLSGERRRLEPRTAGPW